jgi:hypothetical protein
MLARDRFPQLLKGPRCCGVRRDVAANDAPRSDFHDEEHVEHAESSGHDDQEIASHDGLGVISNEGAPALRRSSARAASPRFQRPIGPDSERGKSDSKLQ